MVAVVDVVDKIIFVIDSYPKKNRYSNVCNTFDVQTFAEGGGSHASDPNGGFGSSQATGTSFSMMSAIYNYCYYHYNY